MTSIPNGEVSASKISTAFGRAGCGLKFYYRYIEGLKGPVTASLLAGTAFDKATSALHDNRIVGADTDDPHAVFVDTLLHPPEQDKNGEPIDYDLSDMPDDLEQRGLNALDAYATSTQTMRPLHTQVYGSVEFNESDAKLIGYIDLVEAADTGVCISDVKTSLSARKKWSVDDAVRDLQLAIYNVLYQQTADVTAVGWRYARLGGKVEVGAVHVKPAPTTFIMERLSHWLRDLEAWCASGNFPPTGLDKDSWVCSAKYCDYYQRCPHGQRAQVIVPLTIGGTRG